MPGTGLTLGQVRPTATLGFPLSGTGVARPTGTAIGFTGNPTSTTIPQTAPSVGFSLAGAASGALGQSSTGLTLAGSTGTAGFTLGGSTNAGAAQGIIGMPQTHAGPTAGIIPDLNNGQFIIYEWGW